MLIFWNSRVLFNRQWLMSCICCEQLHVSRCCSQKKKWTKDEVNSLLAWKYETNAICGPCITPKKARNTVSRAKHKATRDIDNYLLNDSQLAVGIIANELKDVETQTSVLPCSTTRRLSSQTVSEALVEKPRSPVPMNSRASHQVTEKKQADDINNNNADSKHNSKDVFVSTQRQQTCGYTWVDSPAGLQQTDNNENTVMSFTRVTDVDSHNVTQNADQVSHCTSGMMNLELSDTDREQSVENSSAAKRQTAEDKTQKNSSDQHILSFPLFASPVLSSEAASVSVRLPSVSAILKATMPPENQLALTRWEQRMIAELGEDGFQEYQKGCKLLETIDCHSVLNVIFTMDMYIGGGNFLRSGWAGVYSLPHFPLPLPFLLISSLPILSLPLISRPFPFHPSP